MPASKNPGEITRLLHAWQDGSSTAQSELWPILYDELRSLAAGVLHRRGRGNCDRPTSLVHKAYLRLLGSEIPWQDRQHFFAVAARAMRFVIADEARRQLSKKRGEGGPWVIDEAMAEAADPLDRRPEEVLAVHQALEKLARLHPRYEKLVELRYFAGLSVKEAAEVLAVTSRTVVRDWKAIRIWLHGELAEPA